MIDTSMRVSPVRGTCRGAGGEVRETSSDAADAMGRVFLREREVGGVRSLTGKDQSLCTETAGR